MKKEVELAPDLSVTSRAIYEESYTLVSVEEVEYPSPSFILSPKKKWAQWKADYVEAQRELSAKSVRALGEDLASKGLLGTHTLLAEPVVDRGIWGQTKGEWRLDGHLFLVFGGLKGKGEMEGSTKTVSSVKFSWSPREGEMIVSEIPADKLVIKHGPENEAPTVSFEFDANAFIEPVEGLDFFRRVRCWSHPNDYLQGDRLAKATLTIATQRLDLLPLPVPEGSAS